MENKANNLWSVDAIRHILSVVGDKAENGNLKYGEVRYSSLVYKMLQALYMRQTVDEQVAGETLNVRNKQGFNGRDAGFLSNVAKNAQEFGTLTPRQLQSVARGLLKYSSQLSRLAAETIAAKAADFAKAA
jgi:hypothetical protein